MHVQYVTLCDQIILGQDGRPSLIGVFNHLNVPALPFTLPRLAFAGRILFTADETGRAHTVEVVITGLQPGESVTREEYDIVPFRTQHSGSSLGYAIVARNHRTRYGEIDLIAADPAPPTFDNTLAALERAGAAAGFCER